MILRAFRKSLKDNFIKVNAHKHTYQKDETIRRIIKRMFVNSKNYNIDKQLYNDNEAIFYILIQHTKTDQDLTKAGI